jgi:hypothetical protein
LTQTGSNISGVAQAAQGTTRGASDTQKASQQLVETAAELRRLVEQFKINASEGGRGDGAASTQPQSKAAYSGLQAPRERWRIHLPRWNNAKHRGKATYERLLGRT